MVDTPSNTILSGCKWIPLSQRSDYVYVYNKKYYQRAKLKNKEKNDKLITCSCGRILKTISYLKHKKTKYHLLFRKEL
jgi:hypothetical protein